MQVENFYHQCEPLFEEGEVINGIYCVKDGFCKLSKLSIKVGDDVYFHITNLEQDWDVPHGFSIRRAPTAELLIMPGETATLNWKPNKVGMVYDKIPTSYILDVAIKATYDMSTLRHHGYDEVSRNLKLQKLYKQVFKVQNHIRLKEHINKNKRTLW